MEQSHEALFVPRAAAQCPQETHSPAAIEDMLAAVGKELSGLAPGEYFPQAEAGEDGLNMGITQGQGWCKGGVHWLSVHEWLRTKVKFRCLLYQGEIFLARLQMQKTSFLGEGRHRRRLYGQLTCGKVGLTF